MKKNNTIKDMELKGVTGGGTIARDVNTNLYSIFYDDYEVGRNIATEKEAQERLIAYEKMMAQKGIIPCKDQ